MDQARKLEQFIQDHLDAEKIDYDRHVALNGADADFLIYAPDGRIITVNLKYWEKFAGYTTHAARQTELYDQDLGVDRAFIVIDGLGRSNLATGVVTPDRLLPALLDEFDRKDVKRKPKRPEINTSPDTVIFAAMPFDESYEDVYVNGMAKAAGKLNAVCKRVDLEEFSGDIVAEIISLIERSAAVVADLSGSNPNVLYELGYAHGLKKPTVHLCSTPLRDLPFNVSHWNTIQYKPGQTYQLGEKIYSRLKAIL